MAKRTYTPQERRKIKHLYLHDGLSARETARCVGASEGGVHRYLKSQGLNRSIGDAQDLRWRATRQKIEHAIELYKEGFSSRKAGKIAGVCGSIVRKEARKQGVSRGKGNHGRRVPDEVIKKVGRMAYERDVTIKDVARRLGMTNHRAYYLVSLYAQDMGIQCPKDMWLIYRIRNTHRLRAQGMTFPEIAEILGVSKQLPWRYYHRANTYKVWRNLQKAQGHE